MATVWIRTVSNTNGKYCVELLIDGTFTRISRWYDTSEEAQAIAQGFSTRKASAVANRESIATNDVLERTLDIAIAED